MKSRNCYNKIIIP